VGSAPAERIKTPDGHRPSRGATTACLTRALAQNPGQVSPTDASGHVSNRSRLHPEGRTGVSGDAPPAVIPMARRRKLFTYRGDFA